MGNIAGAGISELRRLGGEVGSIYGHSALKRRVDAHWVELRRKARGSFAKRVLDPLVFRAPADADVYSRVALLGRAGLGDQVKTRNMHHGNRDMRQLRDHVDSYPDTVQVAVTTVCNLRCKMCAITASGKHYTGRHADPVLFKRIEPMLPFVRWVKLQGTGEPFLYPGMKQACELGLKHGNELMTVTNATVLDEDMARATIPAFGNIFVSIDAASPDTYKHIRCGGKLDQVHRGIELINKYRRQSLVLGLAFTIMRDNVHELPDFVRMAKRLNAQIVRGSWLIPLDGLPWTFGQEPMAHAELMDRWFTEARAVAAELDIVIQLPPIIPVAPKPDVPLISLAPARPAAATPAANAEAPRTAGEAPKPAAKPAPPELSVISNLRGRRVRGTCSLMYKTAYIHVDSSVTPCCHLKGRVGSLETTDFRTIWNSDAMAGLRKEFNSGRLPDACTGCGFLRMGRIGEGALVEDDGEG